MEVKMTESRHENSLKNLIPVTQRTKNEAREISRAGGIASGVARRQRKTLREQLLLMLEDGNVQENLCVALIDKAQEGDTKAFQIIRDTVGEKPTEKVDMSYVNFNLKQSYDEVKALMAEQKRKIIEEQKQQEDWT